ncbi:MAG TPA: tetratricopeptide repeat protein [Rubrobacter sp.]|nr:tetratricopeptide repeat protein [Rubrobacter sp.]
MMMNRERLSFWVRLVAILLAAVFIISGVFLGIGTNVSYNLFDLFGNQDQPQQQNQTPGPEQQIAAAEKELKQDPNDPENIKDLAYLYYTAGRYDDAIQVLQDGQKAAPKDEEIPALLGQIYSQQAQTASGKKQEELQIKAAEAFAASAEAQPDNAEAYLLAGQAYEQAGQPAEAIQYYNQYLDRAPNGQEANQVKERISALLEGKETTGSAQP